MCLVRVWILCVDGTSMYLCIVLDGYVRILGAPQCIVWLHLIDICFLVCIIFVQISQTQTCLGVAVGPGFDSTSPAFVSSSASHFAGPHGWHAQKTIESGPHCWGQEWSTRFAHQIASLV